MGFEFSGCFLVCCCVVSPNSQSEKKMKRWLERKGKWQRFTIAREKEGKPFLPLVNWSKEEHGKNPWDGKSEFSKISATNVFTATKAVLIHCIVTPTWGQSVESGGPSRFLFPPSSLFPVNQHSWDALHLRHGIEKPKSHYKMPSFKKKKKPYSRLLQEGQVNRWPSWGAGLWFQFFLPGWCGCRL